MTRKYGCFVVQEIFAYLDKNPVDIIGLPMDYEVIFALVTWAGR
jgi:hypothetical protein